MTRNGDEVYLSRKQFWSIVGACVTPAMIVAGFLWNLNNRVTTLEVTRPEIVKRIEQTDDSVEQLKTNTSILSRIEQATTDTNRRLERVENAVDRLQERGKGP